MKHRAIIDKLLGWLVTIFMGVLVINVLWQVTSRFVIGHPSSFTDELAGYLLIWVGLLGAAYATGQKQHLAIDLISKRLTEHRKRILDTTINSLIITFAVFILIIGGSNLVYITFHLNQISSALQLPVGYVYLVIPVSGAFIIYYAITDIIIIWKKSIETPIAE
ncbi:TRAP transporter small permease [Perlabentimonas gracilis]|uniref:TRAP transporter small permease n=1 Tax=Perlabentimonas gracilis TaxID=2715279 RepID=UPI00140C37D1|nr:TRAP transporter small permease subunit [Perlabentimonas gracilis]NHB68615.1 TRAP transporter small permease [Perlabentimonas gracilis]